MLDINTFPLPIKYKGIPIVTSDDVPPGTLWLINDDYTIKYPKRKDGKPDMRFGVNRMQKIFNDSHK